ncbi:MAG: PAC2 family protein [Acidimicrobiia bacterium]|nr:PAC2 family protein [Acidimicrobiia bacterium]
MAGADEAELSWAMSPTLRRPIVVVALQGLFDAAEAATAAVQRLARRHDAFEIARIDPENFFDFTQERPSVRFDDDGDRVLEWPENAFMAAAIDAHDRDLVLLAGVEPHLRWRTFSEQVLTVVRRTNADMVVTLGAMAGLAPHTRTLGVVGSSTNDVLAGRLGLGKPSYQGPTGLVGALHDLLDRAEVPVISLRVSVPHYVPGPPNPEATRSLLSRFELVTGIESGHSDLDRAAKDWRTRIDAAVEGDDEMRTYVRQLEAQVDEDADELLPSGDDLAAQLEAFLREHGPAD